MRIAITHTFPCTPEEYWASFDDPELSDKLASLSKMTSELIEERQEGNVTIRRARLQSGVELPTAASSVLGMTTLSYEQTTRIDPDRGVIDWEVIPPVMRDRFTGKGTYVVTPTDDGCERLLEGEISVRVPMFGKRIEKMVVDLLQKAYTAGAKVRTDWILKKRAESSA